MTWHRDKNSWRGGVCEVEAYSCMYGFGGEV